MTLIMLFNVISVIFRSTLNVTIFIDYKYLQGTMILGIVLFAHAQHFFLIA